jgi:hypothetical protein
VLLVDQQQAFRRPSPLPVPVPRPTPPTPTHSQQLDYNATTPIYPEVQAAMQPFTLEQARPWLGSLLVPAARGLCPLHALAPASFTPRPPSTNPPPTFCRRPQFGNPSSGHAYGRRAAAAVAAARASVAALIGCSPDEVYFTSCGTESDAWAIWGAVAAARRRGGALPGGGGGPPHVVTSAVEHPAVLECLRALADQGLCT